MVDPLLSSAPLNASVQPQRRPHNEPDQELLRRIRVNGDTAAFADLFIRYADRIVGAIARHKHCYSDCVRDAVIDAFIDLYENPSGKIFVIDVANDRFLFTWLYRRIWRKTCQYLSLDKRCDPLDDQFYKRQGRRYPYEYLLALRQALRKVSSEMPDHFRILQLTYWDGHGANAAARILADENTAAGRHEEPYAAGSVGRLKSEIIERLREELLKELNLNLFQKSYRSPAHGNFTDWL
jgi:DNA-directed RNA polymerase specialized sigma24 family protein